MSTDREPAWSPDGSTIAFTRDGALALISPEGAGLRGLATPASMVEEPAWAPDGTELAFTCVVEPDNYDICRIRLDGSGFTRLTSDSARDRTPAWSPDGTRIAFTTTRFGPFESVAHMATDGTDLIGITDGRSPSWSPDGEQLVYERPGRGLSTIRRDGTGRFTVSGGAETAPAWRP
jgi:Tol biopolymer transport system component